MSNIVNITDISSITNSTPSNIYTYGSEAVELSQYLENNGYITEGNITYLPNTVQTTNGNVTGNTVITSAKTDNTLELQPKNGMLKTKVSPIDVVMPVLTGCGIGWELYEEYPQFWSDLSEALFSNTNALGWNNTDTSTFIDVIIEAIDEGGVKAYCDKRTAEKIVQTAMGIGAFNAHGSITPTHTETGTYIIPPKVYNHATDSAIGLMIQYGCQTTQQVISNIRNTMGDLQCTHFVMGRFFETIYQEWRYNVAFYRIPEDEPVTLTKDRNGNIVINQKYYYTSIQIVNDPTGLRGYQIDNSMGYVVYGNPVASYTENYQIIYSDIDATNVTPIDSIKYNNENQLPTEIENPLGAFVGWLDGILTLPFIDPSTGELVSVEMLPLSLQDIQNNPNVNPTPQTQTNAQTGVSEGTGIDIMELPEYITDLLSPSIETPTVGVPSENPSGNTPVIIPPSNNNSSKLFTVYNPTSSQLDDLGGYLWSDDISTLIKELFNNNRMDAIISLHQVYCTPSTSTPQNIILGNLNSGVSAKVVNNQYVNIDCGSQYVAEMYGDARDYLNVDCQVYLPFIGFRVIDPHDVINCYIRILYTIDVYTGSCLAQLVITKGSYTQTLYTFEGNCSIQIPLTGSDRARIIGAIASTVATGLVAGTGGAIGAGVANLAGGSFQSNIQRTSGFSGNCGAMAIKKPYIVLSRLKSSDAINFNKIIGYPTNKTVYLINCKGYTRVSAIHLDNVDCTDREKEMLMNILKEGIQI